MQLPVVINKAMTSEMTKEAPIDLSIKVRQDDHPLDLSVKTNRRSSVSPPSPKRACTQSTRDRPPSLNGLGAFKDWMTAGLHSYSPVSPRSLPCIPYPPVHVPWCFRLDISPTFYMAQGKDDINTVNTPMPSVNVAGSTLLMSGGGMLSRSSVEQTEEIQEHNLNGKSKTITTSRRKRKHQNSPPPNIAHDSGQQECAVKYEKTISGGPRVNFSVMSGGGLVNGDSEIKHTLKTVCNCSGGKYNSGLLLCPVHKIQLPKLSIPTDPKDSSWISAYVSTLKKDSKK